MGRQLRDNLVAITSLAVALGALGYNTWRNERTERNRNIRVAGIEMLKEMGSLQQLIFYAHYARGDQRGDPRMGWADVQTIGETVQGFVFDSGWHAVFAPAGTPTAVVARMQQAIHKSLQVPHVHKHFTSNGYVPQGDPPAVWARKFKQELKRYDEFARLAGIEPF